MREIRAQVFVRARAYKEAREVPRCHADGERLGEVRETEHHPVLQQGQLRLLYCAFEHLEMFIYFDTSMKMYNQVTIVNQSVFKH